MEQILTLIASFTDKELEALQDKIADELIHRDITAMRARNKVAMDAIVADSHLGL